MIWLWLSVRFSLKKQCSPQKVSLGRSAPMFELRIFMKKTKVLQYLRTSFFTFISQKALDCNSGGKGDPEYFYHSAYLEALSI